MAEIQHAFFSGVFVAVTIKELPQDSVLTLTKSGVVSPKLLKAPPIKAVGKRRQHSAFPVAFQSAPRTLDPTCTFSPKWLAWAILLVLQKVTLRW
jgi:hypothetical protein